MVNKNRSWSLLKDEMEMAVYEGIECGYNKEDSEYYGKFEVYKYLLDKMNELEPTSYEGGIFND